MQCPECQSTHIRKNGKRKGKQNHICVDCGRQFIDCYDPPKGYSDEVKRECLKMYVNGMGFRAIERVKEVHHTTVIYWVRQAGLLLPDTYESDPPPQVGELDELETFVGSKKTRSGSGRR
jgi:transposase-like protein